MLNVTVTLLANDQTPRGSVPLISFYEDDMLPLLLGPDYFLSQTPRWEQFSLRHR
jgi:hypothetical protein